MFLFTKHETHFYVPHTICVEAAITFFIALQKENYTSVVTSTAKILDLINNKELRFQRLSEDFFLSPTQQKNKQTTTKN